MKEYSTLISHHVYLTLNPVENGDSTYPHNQLDLIWQQAEITCSVLCPVWVLTTRRTHCYKVAKHANPSPNYKVCGKWDEGVVYYKEAGTISPVLGQRTVRNVL